MHAVAKYNYMLFWIQNFFNILIDKNVLKLFKTYKT